MDFKLRLYIEFLLLFILIPISLAFEYNTILKLFFLFLGGVYVLVYLIKNKLIHFIKPNINWKLFFKVVIPRFIIIATFSTVYIYYFKRANFFEMPLNNPKLWLLILGVYSLFSVTLQECMYRTFYFHRFEKIFKNKTYLIIINALVFSLAHSFLKNWLILLFTFVGGVLFALTYFKTRSTLLVCIEHALYGFWLFTVGIGKELAFPES
ncbi:MAG: CPBP family intramembrane metalloprotease [Kordia sp.]|nr:MAG: CPBP family intramembrane metalloprotease [Kordia sp.]